MAAAVRADRQGESWWLTKEEEKLSAENNHSFEIVDKWRSRLSRQE